MVTKKSGLWSDTGAQASLVFKRLLLQTRKKQGLVWERVQYL